MTEKDMTYRLVGNNEEDTKVSPCIAHFQNGQLIQSNGSFQSVQFLDTRTNKTVIAVATENMVYYGEQEMDVINWLGIGNKKDKTLRFVPVSNASLKLFTPPVNNDVLDSTINASNISIRDLNKTFGSKRTIRRTEQIERMKMNVSNVEDELTKTVANIVVNEQDVIAPKLNDNESSIRPPMNREASSVDEVYDLNTLIKPEELDALKELAASVLNDEIDDEKLSEFVRENIKAIQVSSGDQIKKCCILLYIEAIIKFFKVPIRSINKKVLPIEPQYPESILNKILKEFTVLSENNRHRPISMRDKASCTQIVLGLLALDYKLNLETLSKSVGVGLKKLTEISRVLGAQTLSNGPKNSITLKLPLPTGPTGLKRKKK